MANSGKILPEFPQKNWYRETENNQKYIQKSSLVKRGKEGSHCHCTLWLWSTNKSPVRPPACRKDDDNASTATECINAILCQTSDHTSPKGGCSKVNSSHLIHPSHPLLLRVWESFKKPHTRPSRIAFHIWQTTLISVHAISVWCCNHGGGLTTILIHKPKQSKSAQRVV